MAFYSDEEDFWKCPKHPSKRRRACGICPLCLRDRLSALCPICAKTLPCACSATSSPSSSSSFFSNDAPSYSCVGATIPGEQISNLIASELAFRRSSSVATILSRFSKENLLENERSFRKASFWSIFKTQKSKKEKMVEESLEDKMLMRRSRSVAVSLTSTPAKGIGWYFSSPMKAFRKSSKVVQERSALYI